MEVGVDDRRAEAGAERLSAFVSDLRARLDQSVTVVAHSFGSLVAGEALANHDMDCDDVVVLGSPGIGVETLDELHVHAGHFFAEKAPGDIVAGLGADGADPASLVVRGHPPGDQRSRPPRGDRTLQLLHPRVAGPWRTSGTS